MNWESGVDIYTLPCIKLGFSGGLVGKILSAIQETWVQSQGWEDLLEEEMATHSSILAWKIQWDRGGWQTADQWGHKELDKTE